jgi:hypothetical protein
LFCTGNQKCNWYGIGDGNNKNLTRHVFKYKHTKWSRWCITASLNYKNTMINRITMETFACLRSKCHLKQNLILSWPWSFLHTSCISDFRCKTKYTKKNVVGHPDRHTWQYCWSLLTHLCELLPSLGVRCPSVNLKKIFSSETTGPI